MSSREANPGEISMILHAAMLGGISVWFSAEISGVNERVNAKIAAGIHPGLWW